MADAICDEGFKPWFDANVDAGTGWHNWGLYKNNVTPANTTILTDLTDATFPGYVGLQPGWSASSITGTTLTAISHTATWTRSAGGGSENIYGWYIFSNSSKLISAGLFSGGPFTVNTAGQTISLTVTITCTGV